jgi:3-hydroxybutyryl-CoA dehydrogenase
VEIKISFYQELAKVAPEKTIFTTNSSTTLLVIMQLIQVVLKVLALHFANGIWDTNIR